MNQNFIENFQFLVKQEINKRNGTLDLRNASFTKQALEQFLLEDRNLKLSTFIAIADFFKIKLACYSCVPQNFEEQNQHEEQDEERQKPPFQQGFKAYVPLFL